ncbi:MAG: hypothetical protein SWO11_21800, partial [Thermodesulfobacteriota bacterium]|nr:hypothetical protein [Thermodesulfobacteriota bacterium]
QDDRSKAINVGHVKEKWNKILNLIKPFVSHKLLVKKAISEGKPVPEKVLAEYPDLAEKPKYTEDQLKGIKVETTAIREATGEKIKIKEDATAALDSAKKDINEYKKLLNCLR